MVYLDYAATTPNEYKMVTAGWGNSASSHELGMDAMEAEEIARNEIAKKIGCYPGNIIFTSGGTEANNFAIMGYVLKHLEIMGRAPTVLYSPIAHHSILGPIETVSLMGAQTTALKVDERGLLDLKYMREQMRMSNPGLIAIDWVNNEIGTIQPIKDIVNFAHRLGWKVFVDAVQTIPHMAVDFKETDIDFMSISSHKVGGPKGVGALIAQNPNYLYPIISGGSQEGEKRGGTKNSELIAQFGKAVSGYSYHLRSVSESVLKDYLVEKLKGIGITSFYSPTVGVVKGIVNINTGVDSATLVHLLSEDGIYVSSGAACGGSFANSHVIRAIGKDPTTALRVSFSMDTTQDNIDEFVEALDKNIKILKGEVE